MSSHLLASEELLIPPPPAKLPLERFCNSIELFRDRECVCVCNTDALKGDVPTQCDNFHITVSSVKNNPAFDTVEVKLQNDGHMSSAKPAVSDESTSSSIYILMAKAAIACLIWAACSTFILFLTPYVLNTIAFDYPITLAAMTQCGSTIFILVATKLIQPRPMSAREFGLVILPMSLLAALGFILSHAVYMTLNVAFVQMLKAASPITVIIIMVFFGIPTPTKLLFCAVAMISAKNGLRGRGTQVTADMTMSIPSLERFNSCS
ncbi:hypothetical protein SARC_05415 [Sphaeroforma arctica JP610]|uniref:Sugar phosphate transporter domain-containing protein n=1 Tax=Sphaeroforma arctica JP610 TaxID=667725 RepID=A0A0L0G0D2_9EUKA|nr:hypothetical protein SARC_05415 [Sphaeroforma arctica JP610]KNC82296.1 hypothetical protein SARC_05415 [Sphaeroforma arctica JP610]|eukprot:XP_014156198.1 hypothetical protein SARC_05415 [Sphaeroforma arctica JP610]